MTTLTDDPEVPDAPAIAGLLFRRFRGVEDYATMADISKTANLHDGEDFVPDAESLRVEFENAADLVPARDIVLGEVAGQPVAWANVLRQVRDGVTVYGTTGVVLPAWRRRGLGRALLRHNERAIRHLAAGWDDPGGRVYGSWCGDKEGGANELLRAEGYTAVRYGFAMRRPTLDDIPVVQLPEGLELRPVRPEDERRIFDADNEAFRDHWGHREQTDEDFRAVIELPDHDRSLWSVAWDGDEVVGSVRSVIWRTENETLGVKRGWLEHISVRRPWRRRGVARALIADALRRLKAAGMEDAMLGVDAENPTGALELYKSLGFEVKDRGTTYRKAWAPGSRLV